MMTLRIPRLALVISVAILSMALTPNAGLAVSAQAHTTASDPTHFIQTLAAKAIATLTDKTGTLNERESKFRIILHNEFAMKRIGRFVIGIHWRNMDRTQKNAYQKLFSQWILKTYSSLLGGYSGQKFEVTKTSEAGKGDIIVHSRIRETKNDQAIICNWRVRKHKGRFKIIDIYVEGISMAVTQRSQFAAIIKKQGVTGLLKRMEKRLQQLSSL
jgi:phospholipid transport system substrate-binding protein